MDKSLRYSEKQITKNAQRVTLEVFCIVFFLNKTGITKIIIAFILVQKIEYNCKYEFFNLKFP